MRNDDTTIKFEVAHSTSHFVDMDVIEAKTRTVNGKVGTTIWLNFGKKVRRLGMVRIEIERRER